ncbi:MAG TPA: hypothetical protein VK590_09360 [Saprospiraceae bacterium]|nr:hypothetical protein [Saprospiraceae bacterium]
MRQIYNTNRKLNKRIGLIILFSFSVSIYSLMAQDHDRKKADSWYEKKNYALAIPLYEKSIKLKTSLASETKLAYCYKMTNQIDKANLLYRNIVLDPKARDVCYLYYAEGLMSKGQYADAKKWYSEYGKLHPEDPTVSMMLKSLDEIKNIPSYYDSVSIQLLDFNSAADDNAAVGWKGNIVFSSDRPQGASLFKETSGATGRDFINLYIVKQLEDSSWTVPQKFSNKLSMPGRNIAFGSFSEKAGKMVFTRNSSTPDKKGAYKLLLFEAELKGDQIGSVKRIGFCSDEFNYMHPALSLNGDSLYFASDKPGGLGNTDLYLSTFKNEDWSKPLNLGSILNSSASEGFPYIDSRGSLYFCSKGFAGFGGFDVFTSTLDSAKNWTKPVNLGYPVNSPYDDLSFSLNENNTSGYFSSSRGTKGDDIYSFKLFKKPLKLLNAWHQKLIWPIKTNENKLIVDSLIMDIIDSLKYNPWQEIKIVCHTALMGNPLDSNAVNLSREWANEIKDYLIKAHFPDQAITIEGLGNNLPVNKCDPPIICTEVQLSRNKRILVYWR